MSAQLNETNILSNVNIRTLGEMVYIKWVTENNTEDCEYTVQKSINGRDFETLGVKKGITIEDCTIDLMYTYVDICPNKDCNTYYKITTSNKNGEKSESVIYTVNLSK